MERGIRLIGNGQAPVHMYWEKLCGMIESGEIDPLKMDTVYYKFEKREDGMQKVFVETKFSAPPCAGSPTLTRFNK
jgi:threonine dehydrogenase-like Zn-dependent dehydrogenase